MNKNIGFNRNIRLAWLDATASLCRESDDPGVIRAHLDAIVGQEITSPTNRRKAIDILMNIWVKTRDVAPSLRNEALDLLAVAAGAEDQLGLHYGLTLVYYPFFRQTVAIVGQLARYDAIITPTVVKQRLIADLGQLGSLA